jgi:hypothetical protein
MSTGLDSIASVYSEARAEYSKQLCVFLVPAYFKFFTDLLEKARHSMVEEPKKSLWQFQNYLNEIHDWNMEKVNMEIHTIYTNCGCDYLDDLITMVFIAHTKVLTAIRLSSNNKKVEINVPRVEHFLFKALCETAKMLWGSTYLFRDGISGIEKQQNYRQIEHIINEGILQAVRSLLPVKSIIKDYVKNESGKNANADSDSDSDSDSSSDDEEDVKHNSSPKSTEPLPVVNDIIQSPVDSTETIMPTEAVPVVESTPVIEPTMRLEDTMPVPKNEVIIPTTTDIPQTIVLDEKPSVRFGEFDAVFDSDNPLDSDMIFEPKDEDDESVPDLEILDEVGHPLELNDFEDLDRKEEIAETLGADDYEALV